MGVSDFFIFDWEEFLLLYIGRNSVIAVRGCRYKIWKKWAYQKKKKDCESLQNRYLIYACKNGEIRAPVLYKRNKRGMHYAEVRVYTCLFCLSFTRNGQMFFVKILRNFFEKIQKNSCQIRKSRVYLFVLWHRVLIRKVAESRIERLDGFSEERCPVQETGRQGHCTI